MDFTKMINNDLGPGLVRSADGTPFKPLTWRQAITGACTLFELNINPDELKDMAERATIPFGPDHPESTEALRREWFGFVHAGIIYALMGKAPDKAITGYISCTRDLLSQFGGYDTAAADDFIDNTLHKYMELLLQREQRQCPKRLLEAVVGPEYATTLDNNKIAFVSGMMAITLCNILDTLERYTFLPDEDGDTDSPASGEAAAPAPQAEKPEASA